MKQKSLTYDIDTVQILHVDLCQATLATNQSRHWEWIPKGQNKGEPSYRRQSRVGSITGLLLLLSRFSPVQLFVTLWTASHQAPLSMGFSRQEHWSGLPCLPPGDLPDPGIEPMSLMSLALAGRFFTIGVYVKIRT